MPTLSTPVRHALTLQKPLCYLRDLHATPLVDRWWRRAMTSPARTVRIDIGSAFDLLDFVESVSHEVGRLAGFDDDQRHWIGIAVRESVVNAIRHGNRLDTGKRVTVEFSPARPSPGELLTITVTDEGDGFDPGAVADPLAPENLLKPGGRGLFLMRSFMDELEHRRLPGGMETRMAKRVPEVSGVAP